MSFFDKFFKNKKTEDSKLYKKKSEKIFTEEDDRDPYPIQIGIDFGTSSIKCIYRNLAEEKAKIYYPKKASKELPFLFSTDVYLNENNLSLDCNNNKNTEKMSFVKMAIYAIGSEKKDNKIYEIYRQQAKTLGMKTELFVQSISSFLLSSLFHDLEKKLILYYPGFGNHKYDSVNINICIPVCAINQKRIEKKFKTIINKSWVLKDLIYNNKKVLIQDWANKLLKINDISNKQINLYPEISATLQIYSQSNSFQEGVYLLTDVGAGTVDQAIFYYNFLLNKLSFWGSHVYPLGSSNIEFEAEDLCDLSLNKLREMKENGNFENIYLRDAVNKIREKSNPEICKLVTQVRRKLNPSISGQNQILKAKLLFSGGGFIKNPYEYSIQDVFTGPMFKNGRPLETIGFPNIDDIDIDDENKLRLWMSRLHVAYGLSFSKVQLSQYKYPEEINDKHIR